MPSSRTIYEMINTARGVIRRVEEIKLIQT